MSKKVRFQIYFEKKKIFLIIMTEKVNGKKNEVKNAKKEEQ